MMHFSSRESVSIMDPGELPGNTIQAAKALLGSYIILADRPRRDEKTVIPRCGGMIIETEAYTLDDPASHSFGGKTRRNRVMFAEAGFLYVYRSYGIHHCMNIVTGDPGSGEAVLIRSLLPIFGLREMRERRFPVSISEKQSSPAGHEIPGNDLAGHNLPEKQKKRLCSGPGNVCSALGVDMSYNGFPVCVGEDSHTLEWPDVSGISGIFLVEGAEMERVYPVGLVEGFPDSFTREIRVSPRIGITKNPQAPRRFFYSLPGYVSRSTAGRTIA